MGLTKNSTGINVLSSDSIINNKKVDYEIGLAGNPNVGKSTVFNALTGLKQHTGNWPGKTVANAEGFYEYKGTTVKVVDLPGTYSLLSNSEEEEIAKEYICSNRANLIVVVADATSLERNLNLFFQIAQITDRVILCINLIDEALKKGIEIDEDKVKDEIGDCVVFAAARSNIGIEELKEKVYKEVNIGEKTSFNIGDISKDEDAVELIKRAEAFAEKVVKQKTNKSELAKKVDRILVSKKFGIPIMIVLLLAILWITITLANYPSELLSRFFSYIEVYLREFFSMSIFPSWVCGVLVDGLYVTLSWVVAVMLPPMAIFFPLFTLLEDLGYLPRIAFNLDKCFKKCCSCGKQALTMCMGLGCNAAGVIGCRIINSPRERLVAILTNVFVPCNGRFPTLITIATIFIGGSVLGGVTGSLISALAVTIVIVLGVVMTLIISRVLSKTILKGVSSNFILELPPYRRPQIAKVLVRSICDRTLYVLGRAVVVAAPVGVVIWIFANINIGDSSILSICADFLNPFAQIMGLDGYILMAFILGFPANEIVMPIIIMSYLKATTIMEFDSVMQLKSLLIQNGWTLLTAINMMILCLMHYPCATTMWTIKKETNSWKWTVLAFAIPTVVGIVMCLITTQVWKLIC